MPALAGAAQPLAGAHFSLLAAKLASQQLQAGHGGLLFSSCLPDALLDKVRLHWSGRVHDWAGQRAASALQRLPAAEAVGGQPQH